MNSILPGRILRTFQVAGVITVLFSSVLFAQNASTNALPSNRWLLMVETSQATQPRAQAIQQIAATLVFSGVNGQMRPGDTLGVWTFNDKLEAGQFPLQRWSPPAAREVAAHVSEFLKNQKYENGTQFSAALEPMERVIKNSDFITVILLTDGSEKISGTPFDEKINDTYAAWNDEQQRQHQPFVTLLRADHGVIRDFVVNTPPWPFKIPPLPKSLFVAENHEPKAAPPKPKPKPKPPVHYAPPLIISGKHPAAEAPRDSTAPTAGTNGIAPQGESAPKEVQPATAGKSQPSPIPQPKMSTSAPPKTSPEVVHSPSSSGSVPKPDAVAPSKVAVQAQSEVASRPIKSPGLETRASSGITSGGPVRINEATTPENGHAALATKTPAKPIQEAGTGTVNSNAPGESVQTAVAIAPDNSPNRIGLWIGLGSVGITAIVLWWIVARRARQVQSGSLITRSLDRQQK